jgi:hypothetical protein
MSYESEINTLHTFAPISLTEMDEVKLMNRTDTKFVFKRSWLDGFLKKLATAYHVLKINDNLISNYNTLYFDTENFDYYIDHHNGRVNRYKVRIRNYVESDLFFLEIKNKYKGRTDKKRIRINGFEHDLSENTRHFINSVIETKPNLEAKLWNRFSRITLVNPSQKERLTLDLDLGFSWEDQTFSFSQIVIAELKQENVNRESLFYSLMKQNGILPNSISKYCIGAINLYPALKYNNFKSKTLLLNKLTEI